MRELSVVGPASTPSSVCTHCLSGSCDQHSGHKEVGTLLNLPGHEGLLEQVTYSQVSCKGQERRSLTAHTYM